MRWLLLLAAAAMLGFAAPASAHRLDEYLQAATINVARDHLGLRMILTPGVDVAEPVIAAIDRNGDGVISASEQAAYARAIQADLALAVDGRPRQLRLVAASFPPEVATRGGVGDIVLDFTATPVSAGTHSLTLANRYAGGNAVYLVNTLLPQDPDIAVLGQQRSYDQARYRLDLTIGAAAVGQDAQALRDQDRRAMLVTYGWHGVWHILTGYDHLLFVAGLVLGAAGLWDLVKVVTAFTLAHSLTLTLAALGLVHAPEAIVEPLIAASIVAVAAQNVLRPNQTRGAGRLVLTFGFGLVHGLGFASGMLEIMHAMPRQTMALAILGFSLGVEAGNQMVLLPLFGTLRLVDKRHRAILGRVTPAAIRRWGSIAIVLAGGGYMANDLFAPG